MPTFKKMLAGSAPAEDKTSGTAAEAIMEPLSVAAGRQAVEDAYYTEEERRELEMAEAVRQADELREKIDAEEAARQADELLEKIDAEEAARQADELLEKIDAEEAASAQSLQVECSPASGSDAAPTLEDALSEIPFAEVSEDYSGQWAAEGGKVVAWIKDGKMKGVLGTAVDLTIRSRDTCTFELGGETHTGKLGDDGKLSWSHGAIWTRRVRGVNKQATIHRTVEQPKPVPHRNIEEHRERLSFPTHISKLWEKVQPVEQPECKLQKSREEQQLEEQQRKAFEEARMLSEAGIAKAKERREEERIRKATAKERAKKAKEFDAQATPGMIVRVCGLTRRKDMNDQIGELLQWNEENERWQVEMDNGSGSKLLKSENLEVVDMGEEGGRKGQSLSEEDEERVVDSQWTAEEWAAWEKQSVTVD